MFWVLSGHLARLGFSVLVPQEKYIFSPYNQSFIDRACLVKIAKYWPLFFLRFYCARVLLGSLKKYTHTSTQKHKKKTWPISRHLDFTLSQKRIQYMLERVSRFFHHVARSLSSAVISQGCAFLLLSFSSFGPFLIHKAAFARDLSYLAPKGVTIAPH